MVSHLSATSPIDAITAHHAEMEAELRRRVDDLIAAVALGEPAQTAASAVIDYAHSTLLPHAAAEEESLYAAAARFEPRLVQSLVGEHATLRNLVSELAGAREPAGRAGNAGAIVELFASHAAKENDYVLPALLEGAPAELPDLMRSMHDAFERQSRPRVAATLDVRGIPHAARHGQIFGRLESLAAGEALAVVNDHDPVPLRHQLDALWPGGFTWSYEDAGPELWRVLITRREGPSRPPAATAPSTEATSGNGHATAAAAGPSVSVVVSGMARLLGRSLRSLGEAGRQDEASHIAADAWAMLREIAPAEAARLSGLMHGLARASLETEDGAGDRGTDGPELDVRSDPPAQRHQRIFDAFAALAPGTSFILVNDHDPVPLRYQFTAEHPGEVEWEALEEGPEVWRVRIGRSPMG